MASGGRPSNASCIMRKSLAASNGSMMEKERERRPPGFSRARASRKASTV
jgi:hypothetical protein